MLEQNASTQVDLSETRQKRKYTKHDYFADLDKKFLSWKLCEGVLKGSYKFYQKRDQYNLSVIQDEVLEYVVNFDSKEGKLLASSEKVQKLYAEVQDLLNQNPQTDEILSQFEEKYIKLMRIEAVPSLMENLKELFKDRARQKQRIICIESLLRHEKKQEENEKKEYNRVVKERQQTRHWFHKIPKPYELSMKRRLSDLSRRIKKDESEIKEIKLDLERRARTLLEEGEKYFSEGSEKRIIADCQKYYSKLETALVSDYKLKRKLESTFSQFRKVIEQEKIKLTQQKMIQKPKEKSSEEKIQDGFDMALQANQNLVLVGKYRSLGLTNTVIKEINKDDKYKHDIVDHILGLLETPEGQDFSKSGNTRWKRVQGSDSLYELSVNPKLGHQQTMPRLYAKKEVFVKNGLTLELTNTKEKRSTESVWVLVKKGSKRTQENDMDMAEKVFFKNDGKQCGDQIVKNNLGWMKVSLVPLDNPVRAQMISGRSEYQ